MLRVLSQRLLTEGCRFRSLPKREFAVCSYANCERTNLRARCGNLYYSESYRKTSFRDVPVAFFSSMREGEVESYLCERSTKRRRISTTTVENEKNSFDIMTHTAKDQVPTETSQPLFSVSLTPAENVLKILLLGVAQYIREKKIVTGGIEISDYPETVLRFTGGWVRDKLLGVVSHDVDVGISSMTGYQFGMALKQYLDIPENLEGYKKLHPDDALKEEIVSLHKIDANPEKSKHLETVTTKIFGFDVDLVNLRKETYSEESRNPQMEFGTAREDAMRRDATVNALFYNLNESKLEDFTGRGIEDMKNKLIRTPLEPYQTFKDDPLRVLRLIRFASRLGYSIHGDTEKAMQNSDIGIALRLKISKERVGKEVENMLRGPDPRGALHIIHRLGLYPTIFAYHRGEVSVDTSSWSLAYDSLERLLHTRTCDNEDARAVIERVRSTLIRDANETYYAWIIATFAPWSTVPTREMDGPKGKPQPVRAAEVARDSLRSDNKTVGILNDAVHSSGDIKSVVSSLVGSEISGTNAETRQKIGLHIRSWKGNWRLCVLLAIFQEIMTGGDFFQVIQKCDAFLTYIVRNDLQEVCDMRAIVNGSEIAGALAVEPGPWMSQAMSMAIEWQLLHPEITEKEKALQAISDRKAELGMASAK